MIGHFSWIRRAARRLARPLSRERSEVGEGAERSEAGEGVGAASAIALIRRGMVAMVAMVAALAALGAPAPARADPPVKGPEFVAYPEAPVVTRHQVTVGGKVLTYEASAGVLALVDAKSEPTARLFSVSYRLLRPHAPTPAPTPDESGTGAAADAGTGAPARSDPGRFPDPATRPILFAFNGGPGSSSIWLHLGAFGPRRVEFADAIGNGGPPPYRLVDNEATLLDVADLVFIDPVSTGFSRAAGDTSAKSFHGVEQDIESVAEFIRRFLTREERWLSPKYIAGESYGTTRAAGLADALWERHGIALDGVILVSAVLDFATLRPSGGNELPYPLILPTFTAVAHAHGALAPELQARPVDEVLAAAERFASGPFASVLLAGDGVAPEARQAARDEMARLTGLSREFLDRHRLRVSQGEFCKELLRHKGLVVGRLDGRFVGRDRDDSGESPEFDPSYETIKGLFAAGLNDYVRRELGFRSDLPYELIAGVGPWDFGQGGDNRYLSVADRLRRTMHEQPSLRVYVAEGITDLATPYHAAEYSLSHLGLADELRTNIVRQRFAAGHMMYIDAVDRMKLAEALRGFVGQGSRGPGR